MIIGTFFTLFIVPAIYVLLAKDHSHDNLHEAPEPEASDEPVREREFAVF